MVVRIVYHKAFRRCRQVEFGIGGDQGRFKQAEQAALVTKFQGSGKLDGIVAAQAVALRHIHGERHRVRCNFEYQVTGREVAAERVERDGGIGCRNLAASLTPCHCRDNLCTADTSHIQHIGCGGISDALHPQGTRLRYIPFDECAAIQ